MRSPRRIVAPTLVIAVALAVLAPAATAKDGTYDGTDSTSKDATYSTKDGTKYTKDADTIVLDVTPGAFCSPEGALGKTSAGKKLYCSRTKSDARARWRSPHDLPGGFADTWGSSHAKDIAWLSAKGITRGCNPPNNTRFCPRDGVSREQLAAFMVRALELTDDRHPGFKDVPKGSTFDRDVRRLARAGITKGCNPPKNDLFCPKRTVSRGEMSAFMVRALGLEKASSSGFADVDRFHTFKEDVDRLAAAGITKGCNPPKNDRFCPNDPVSREQMASFIERGKG